MSSDDEQGSAETPKGPGFRMATDAEFAAHMERTQAWREQAIEDGFFDIETYRARSAASRPAS